MSEFKNLIASAFSEACGQIGVTLTFGGSSATVIANRVVESKFLRENGYLPDFDTEVEIATSDFDTLAITNRSVVTLAGKEYIVIGIGRDLADACTMLSLKAAK